METQEGRGVDSLRYRVDEQQGETFRLVDAPDAQAAADVHRDAHGLVADEISAVTEGDRTARPVAVRGSSRAYRTRVETGPR